MQNAITTEQNRRRFFLQAVGGALVALIAAITFGGGGITGTGGRMTSFARVFDFGSIWVAGIEYFTTTANITIDNVPGQPESALKLGMVVKVDGNLSADGLSATATTVVHNTDLRGALSTNPVVAPDGVSFSVHGLPVKTDSRTVVGGIAGAELLLAGNRVIVSGVRDDSSGVIRASRIDALPAVSVGTVLRGTASVVTATTLSMGNLTVNISGATLNGVTLADIAAGTDIRVRASGVPVSGLLTAQRVERGESDSWSLMSGNLFETEGLVSGRTGSTFVLNGVTVTLSPTTVFVNGTLTDLVNGAMLEAKGVATGTSQMTAEEIKFPDPEPIDAEGVVAAKSSTGGLTLISATNGMPLVTTAETEFRDSSRARVKSFSYSNLNVGDRVRVRALRTKTANVAQRVERFDPAFGFNVNTRIFEAKPGLMVVGDAIVLTNAATVFRDANGAIISSDAFYARAIGMRVRVRGAASGSTLTATSAEMQK